LSLLGGILALYGKEIINLKTKEVYGSKSTLIDRKSFIIVEFSDGRLFKIEKLTGKIINLDE
jgi:hypothetical protein